jgi:hypothetical protein
LRRVLDPRAKLPGTQPEDYGLPRTERLNEAITQSWNRLRKHWAEFRTAVANLREGEAATGVTNDKWTLPLLRELGFGLLPTTPSPEVGGRTYAINRFFGPAPLHLVGCGVSLDRRATGVRGAAAANPHGLLQEFLNRSSAHMWGIVTNGLRLRVLRDNQALSRQSFLEFDLEAMFAGEIYSDFVLFWLVVHATRFAPREDERPETCWLEQWAKLADEQGTRALGDLRGGVERSLQVLGEGFTSHPKNVALREALRSGELPLADFHGQLLRVVYRLIFLFVAEDRLLEGRPLLHPPDNSDAARLARERYSAHYSATRLRELASKIKGSRHGDLWRQFQIVVRALSGDPGCAAARDHLALPALGSFLWDPASTVALNDAELSNHDFLEAVRQLAFTRQDKVLRPVDYRNLGAEELGGVYESLLALTPQISADGARFTFAEFAGSERKTSGSYYTPDSLVQCLLDSALDPVVEEAIKGKAGTEAEKAILGLKVCDPAVGSGHFLVGAAHRLARHLARVRAIAQGESEPSPVLYQHALRDVIGRCLYGVDVNPMAAELCRVSLWLEALEPGKPLSFLDHHIRVGNSLLGATPELIAAGLPDEAFIAIEGDDKKACAVLKKRNKVERAGLGPLFAQQDAETQARLEEAAAALEALPDDRPEDIRAKETAFRRHEETEEYRLKKRLADTWCAAFVIKKYFREPGREASASGITQGHLNDLAQGRPLPADIATEVDRLTSLYRFFHWHLAFPEVFAKGGFDCVLSNPPWEQTQVSDQEFFASSAPEIAMASGEVRKQLIRHLASTNPALHAAFMRFRRDNACANHLVRNSNRYPLTAKGKINTYALFAETNRAITRERGRAGFIVPTGIATDDTTKLFFQDLVSSHHLVSLIGFDNTEGLFPTVKSSTRFCLVTLSRAADISSIRFSFFLRSVTQMADPTFAFTLTADELARLSPNTRTCPVFRTARDCILSKSIYRRVPVLLNDAAGTDGNPWDIDFTQGLFNTTTDSGCFKSSTELEADGWVRDGNLYRRGEERCLPLFEAKMAAPLNHRAMTFIGDAFRDVPVVDLCDANYLTLPQYWVEESRVRAEIPAGWDRQWLAGWQDITDVNTMARSVKAAIIPLQAVADTFLLHYVGAASARGVLCLQALLNSFPLDYVARQKIGGVHLKYPVFKQLAVLSPAFLGASAPWDQICSNEAWISARAVELAYTTWDLEVFARDCAWSCPPFRWDEERRFLLRCELDAAFFHLYLPSTPDGQWRIARQADGCPYDETPEQLAELKQHFPTPRDAVAYIMDTFPIVRRNDEEKYGGDYRTKRVILEIYDAMQESIRTGRRYQTRLDPPPADPRCCHPARSRGIDHGQTR